MASYHEGERTPRATELLAAEVQVVAGWVMEWEQWPRETRDLILRPVEAELLTLYGREEGGRLSALFRESFGGPDARSGPARGAASPERRIGVEASRRGFTPDDRLTLVDGDSAADRDLSQP